MGSKASLLNGDLGEILLSQTSSADRFVDLFAGSGVVSHFIAENTSTPVLSVDLQVYARVFAASITERISDFTDDPILGIWLNAAHEDVVDALVCESDYGEFLHEAHVVAIRKECARSDVGFISRHYGGHYFSRHQALAFDKLYAALPSDPSRRTVALAAILHAASVCAAAPGHTAQPFQPTETLLPYIAQAWRRDALAETRKALKAIAPRHANVVGMALAAPAEMVVPKLVDGDVVFCDPPYSAVQYSRFYHVLEGIARGGWDQVTGKGRAPDRSKREVSAFSLKSKASAAMKGLLQELGDRGCRVVITFPDANASNGLSGNDIIMLAYENWNVESHYVDSVHSTLGGASGTEGRGGRRRLKEAVIVLTPKSRKVYYARNFKSGSLVTPGSDADFVELAGV